MRFDFSGSLNDGFAKEVVQLPSYLLDDAAEWIQKCLAPEDVFTTDQLVEWARNNGFVEEE
jgi:hypothetical protein